MLSPQPDSNSTFDSAGPFAPPTRVAAASLARPTILRALIPALCLAICGCSSRITQEDVKDVTGNNRLMRIDKKSGSFFDMLRGVQSFNFDSLVWQTNAGGQWYDHAVISQRDFQGSSPRLRWVSQIHSLDATKGTAIIKVAEGNVPEGSPSILYTYSWREWSMLTNGEVRLIRNCATPFEDFEQTDKMP
jgi:hypothetical protein